MLPRSPEDFSNLGPVLHANNVLELVTSELIQVCETQDKARNVLTYGAMHTVGVDGKIISPYDDDSTDADTVDENIKASDEVTNNDDELTDADTVDENIEASDEVTNDNDLASPSHSVSRDDENIEASDEVTNDNDLASPSHSVSRDDENIEASDEALNAETISFGDGITLTEENLLVEVMRTQSNIDMTEYIGPIKMDGNGKGYYLKDIINRRCY